MSKTESSDPAARPPRRGCAPSGTATSANTRQAMGNASRVSSSTLASRDPKRVSVINSFIDCSGMLRCRGCAEPAHLNGPVALTKGRKRVMIGILARKLMRCAALEVQLQLALLWFGNHNGAIGQGHLRAPLSSSVCDEYPVPLRAACRNVVHIQDLFRKPLVKHARLHLKGDLRADECRFGAVQRPQRPRAHPRRHEQRE